MPVSIPSVPVYSGCNEWASSRPVGARVDLDFAVGPLVVVGAIVWVGLIRSSPLQTHETGLAAPPRSAITLPQALLRDIRR
jgi:hypothetical protein